MVFDGSTFIRHVAERLIHEFQFSQGAGTPGLVGAAKEHPARIQLERLMTGGVAIGSGIVVDSYGAVSRQQDIVIFEKLCPVFTHSGAAEATYYPVEGVIAVGEVKSGLGKAEILDSFLKSKSVKALRRSAVASKNILTGAESVSFRNYGNGTSFDCTRAEQYDQEHKSLDQVFSFVLCQRLTSSPETTLNNFIDECRNTGVALALNMVTSLEDGSIFPYNAVTNSITRAMLDGNSAIFSRNPVGGFAQLLSMLRLYVMSGRTVERKVYEKYFRPTGAPPPSFTIDALVAL
jgi:hypothetical protein